MFWLSIKLYITNQRLQWGVLVSGIYFMPNSGRRVIYITVVKPDAFVLTATVGNYRRRLSGCFISALSASLIF